MQHTLITLVLASLTAADAPAQAQPSAEFNAIKNEYDAAEVAYRDVVVAKLAKTKAEGKRLYIPFEQTPPARFAARFLEFAEKHPDDPAAFDALARAVMGSYENHALRVRTLERLRASYVTDPRIKRLVVPLLLWRHDESDRLVYEVIARNPDREIRILAYKALIHRAEKAIDFAARIRADEPLRKDLEANEGKPYVEGALAQAELGTAELEGYRKIAHDLFGDRVPDLSIGKPAPELVSRTLDDREVRLSDYRGKVVVLDIWATWCGPCREMIPHERAMVARLKDKPFALISVSVDEKKETLTGFLASEDMPWTHWWNGSEGKIIDALDVDHYPTVLVLDARGVIRAKELHGEALEEAITSLLDEMAAKGTD